MTTAFFFSLLCCKLNSHARPKTGDDNERPTTGDRRHKSFVYTYFYCTVNCDSFSFNLDRVYRRQTRQQVRIVFPWNCIKYFCVVCKYMVPSWKVFNSRASFRGNGRGFFIWPVRIRPSKGCTFILSPFETCTMSWKTVSTWRQGSSSKSRKGTRQPFLFVRRR